MIDLKLNNATHAGICDDNLPIVISANIIESCDPNWSHSLHSHGVYSEIIFITEGSGTLIHEGKKHMIENGDIIIINPGVLHEEYTDPNKPRCSMAIRIHNLQTGELPDNYIMPPYQVPILKTGYSFETVNMVFKAICNEYELNYPDFSSVGQQLLLCLLNLLRYFPNAHTPREKSLSHKEHESLALDIKRYLDENYMHNLSLESLSEHFHFSKYYISHTFKKGSNTTISQYLLQRRIGEAQRLLIDTDLSIKEIAHMVGYENVSHFYDMFKKLRGCSPGSCRGK